MVKTKAAIASANSTIYPKIFRLAELKRLVAVLSGLDTKSGTHPESGGYGSQVIEIQYVAQISKSKADELITKFRTEMEQLQDELDEFNVTHSVKL